MAATHFGGIDLDAGRLASAFAMTVRGAMAFSDPAKISDIEMPAEAPDPDVANAAPLRILMVDDDVLILMFSVEMLEDLGYSVTSATSGADALEILQADPLYDLLITDFSMPKMSGLQLALAVRAFLPALPILLATGYAELPVKSDLVLPQLSKPYVQADLQTAVEALLAPTNNLNP